MCIFEIIIFNTNEKTANPAKTCVQVAVVKKIYVRETATVNLSKMYLMKNAKKTCKPNNRDLNRGCIVFTDLSNVKIPFLKKWNHF